MTVNAYYSKKVMDMLIERSYRWKWNGEKFIKVMINDMEKAKLKKIRDRIFDSYMNRIYMTVILNRNIDKNYLVNVLTGYDDEKNEESIKANVREAIGGLLEDQGSKEK